LHKIARFTGTDSTQGSTFGKLEAGRGFIAAALGTLAVWVFAGTDSTASYNYSIVLLGVSLLLVLLALLFIRLQLPTQDFTHPSHYFGSKLLKVAFRNSRIWLLSGIILCAYVGYKITDDISLYAYEVLGFNQTEAAATASGALWLRPLFALGAGLLADRYSARKIMRLGFLLILVTSLLIASGYGTSYLLPTLAFIGFSLAGIYGIRGIYFALLEESAVPRSVTGTAVGVISWLGYTPDIFISPFMGYLLDRFPGASGHQLVFLTMGLFSIAGIGLLQKLPTKQ
jgi:Na+/melibiose symporter-like transporter